MQVESNAESPKGSIMQYFRTSSSYHLSLRSLFCLFLSGRFTLVLLYILTFYVRIGMRMDSKARFILLVDLRKNFQI